MSDLSTWYFLLINIWAFMQPSHCHHTLFIFTFPPPVFCVKHCLFLSFYFDMLAFTSVITGLPLNGGSCNTGITKHYITLLCIFMQTVLFLKSSSFKYWRYPFVLENFLFIKIPIFCSKHHIFFYITFLPLS